ncbi:MAG: cell division protein FtsQ [Limimaricola sp.]|uniref:cell division protein FtsQ/DivIB n=1 Tax=Limimaricola sp. TaxID=2211665 RepID=UPI001D5D49A2|nr:cell division protein FtsQ/DivIB [Limimaricola sp.]MBI1418571.1 cell division protein FtsQ [Limimaricola sp.]
MQSLSFFRGATRRDPAPSRLDYRMQRMMLTPSFRALLRVGVPMALIAIIVSVWLDRPENRALVMHSYAQAIQNLHNRPEFRVATLDITGASPETTAAVRAVLHLSLPVSSFDLDLTAMRHAVEAIPAVRDATLGIGPGGTLQVAIVPRVPVAIWRGDDGLQLIDAEGELVAPLAARTDRLDLPLIAGDGASDAMAEALQIYAAAGPLGPRIRGLVRMGERRWDVVLDHDQRILLPADGAPRAFERAVAMQQAQGVFDRAIVALDLRNEDRPTIRLSKAAPDAAPEIKASITGTGQ